MSSTDASLDRPDLVMVIAGQEKFLSLSAEDQQRRADSVPRGSGVQGEGLLIADVNSEIWAALPSEVQAEAVPVSAKVAEPMGANTDYQLINMPGLYEKGWVDRSLEREPRQVEINLSSPRFTLDFFVTSLQLANLKAAKTFRIGTNTEHPTFRNSKRFQQWVEQNRDDVRWIVVDFKHGSYTWMRTGVNDGFSDDIANAIRTQSGYELQTSFMFKRYDANEVQAWLHSAGVTDANEVRAVEDFVSDFSLPKGVAIPPADIGLGVI